MNSLLTFKTVKEYCAFNQQLPLHPLMAVVDLSLAEPRHLHRMRFELYTIFLKEIKCGDLRYGCGNYDYEEGTLIFIGPGQVVGSDEATVYDPKGLALVFHPDFLLGSTLTGRMEEYSFFDYELNEALHLSERERILIQDCFNKVRAELTQNIDKHTKRLLVSNLELLLNYCVRFYDRQFITRENVNRGVLASFERLLNEYFGSDRVEHTGLPTVGYFAEQLHLSTNYFGDLIKKETGKSAQDYVQLKLIQVAKERLHDPVLSIAEVAYGLGFAYPQHFGRMFKKVVGVTPGEFRKAG